MDGLIKDCANRQFRGFALAVLLLIAAAFGGGYFLAERTTHNTILACNQMNLAVVGNICNALPEHKEEIKTAFLTANKQDVAAGDELIEKYALSSERYHPETSPYYNEVRAEIYESSVLFSVVLLLVLGAIALWIIHSLFHEIRKATHTADCVLQSCRASTPKANSADSAALIASIMLLSSRLHNLVGQLKQEKCFLHDFMQDISHQLKTPLAVLQLNHDILCGGREIEKSKQDEFLEINCQQLERMNWLIQAQLKLGRLDAEVVEYHCSKQPLSFTCKNACAQLMPLAEEKGLYICNAVDDTILLDHDSGWIAEAISNLIKNAIEHTESGGITLSAEESPLSVQLTIADTGKGMTHEQMIHLFDRFSVSSNAVNAAGTGIGMAIAKKIITDHRGDINVESRIGSGTKLILIFLKSEKNSEKRLTNLKQSDILL